MWEYEGIITPVIRVIWMAQLALRLRYYLWWTWPIHLSPWKRLGYPWRKRFKLWERLDARDILHCWTGRLRGPCSNECGWLQDLRAALSYSQRKSPTTEVLKPRNWTWANNLNELGSWFLLRVSRKEHSKAKTSISISVENLATSYLDFGHNT